MVFPEVKIKEKKNSFVLKMKINKEEVMGVVLDAEDVVALKSQLMNQMSERMDEFIISMFEDVVEIDEIAEIFKHLNTVKVVEVPNEPEEEMEEEVEEEETNEENQVTTSNTEEN